MSEGCLRCGADWFDRDDPMNAPTSRSFEKGWRHYECELRRRWQEWKELVADMNGMDLSEVTLSAETPTTDDTETEDE